MKKNRATRKRRSSTMENDKIDATINDVIRSGTPCCSTAAAAAAAVDLSIKKRRSPPVVPDACRRQTFVHAVSSPPHHQQGLIGRVIYLTPDDRRLTNMEDVAKFLKEGKSNESSLDQFSFDPRVVSGEYYFIAQNGHAHKFTPEDTRPITRTLGYKI
uniref:MBD domain-containing protein n=1 Tax=Romanomermis culicivorax TaxID=13658 RepID=A0A915LDR3_ROMCU